MGDIHELILPDFPVLERCLLIDSSIHSRQDLLKDIKASGLFVDIVEAPSLKDAAIDIHRTSYDLCVLGPSVSLQAKEQFMKEALEQGTPVDCAFVSVVREVLQMVGEQGRAHVVLTYGLSKGSFTEGMIRALLLANKGTSWPGVRLNSRGDLIVLSPEGVWKEWGVSHKKDKSEENDLLAAIIQSCDNQGADNLDPHSKSQVRKIIEKLLVQIDDPKVAEIEDDESTRFFYSVIRDWMIEVEFSSEREATQSLRAKLLRFYDTKREDQKA